LAKRKKNKLISIIVPAYNEQDNVQRVYDQIKNVFTQSLENKYDFEIVFTDNHSQDNTFAELQKIAAKDKRVRVARFTRNFGFNKSLLTGYRLAKGDAAIQIDCDLQDPPQMFPKFLELWEQGHDVVVGLRQKRPEPGWLLKLRKIFYRLLSQISEDNLVVDGGDFRLVDRHVLDQLKEIYIATPYVRGLVSSLSRNQTGFAYERKEREFGESKFPFIKLVGLAIEGVVNHSTLPLRLASLLGFAIATVTGLLAVTYLIGRIFFELDWPAGFATNVILELFGISLNAILLGIIGEYLSRLYQQQRAYPITVIEKTLNL